MKQHHTLTLGNVSRLFVELVLKVVLNIQSTLVMGRLGRYENNFMTYVRPSNNKLIDRAIRYAQHIVEAEGLPRPSYESATLACFEELQNLKGEVPIVMHMVERLKK